MFRKLFAKLVGLEGWPKAKPETTEEKFRREQKRESELAMERQQVIERRRAEERKIREAGGWETDEQRRQNREREERENKELGM